MDDKRRNQEENEDVILGNEQSEVTPESEEQDAGQVLRQAQDKNSEYSRTASMTESKELEQAKLLAAQFENNYKRALADYQNLQRRTQEEKAEWIRMAGRETILKLLPVLDTLYRAASHIQDKGLDLSIEEFLKVLQQENVTRIDTKGKDFDPQTMEAVSTQETDQKKKGKVIEEVRAGYMYHDSVLRPAQVIVGQ